MTDTNQKKLGNTLWNIAGWPVQFPPAHGIARGGSLGLKLQSRRDSIGVF